MERNKKAPTACSSKGLDTTDTSNGLHPHFSTSERPANTGNLDALPVALRMLAELEQWVGYRLEYNGKTEEDGTPKPDKVPYNPFAKVWKSDPDKAKSRGHASTTSPVTWGTYTQAVAALKKHGGDGVGFVFHSKTSPVMGVDIDHCITEGQLSNTARDIVDLLDCYTEVSPSGTGLHLLMHGAWPHKGRKNEAENVEVYAEGRYFTVTGNHLAGTPDAIEDRTTALAELHDTYFPERLPANANRPNTGEHSSSDLADAEVLDLAFAAKNGKKIKDLYYGNTSDYESRSQADAALSSHFAFYTKDPEQLTRLLEGSKLARAKWERSDYLPRTIDSSVAAVQEQYHPPAPATDDLPTDMGNAARFLRLHGHDLRFVREWGEWACYRTGRWVKDFRATEAYLRAKDTVRAMYIDALDGPYDQATKKERSKHALKSQEFKRLRDMLNVAQSDVALSLADMDTNDWILNCPNGTLDLRTSTFRAHQREDLLSKITSTPYDPEATCPTWDKCLEDWLPDAEVRNYFQEAIGYSLTGSVQEQCFFFLYGGGRNGKGTSMNTIHAILGDYAQTARPEILLAKKGDGGIGNEIAGLKGARLVVTKEVERGKPFSEAQLKALTGGDKRRGRFLFQNDFEYWPTDKIFLEANHKPHVRDLSLAFWRRVKLIPFTFTVPENKVDPELDRKLRAEWPGILAWAVRGCERWRDRGRLAEPLAVREATAAYRDAEDVLGDFIADHGSIRASLKTPLADVYKAYLGWCDGNRERPASKREFSERLSETQNLSVGKGTHGHTYVFGLVLKGTAITGDLPTDPVTNKEDTPPDEVF